MKESSLRVDDAVVVAPGILLASMLEMNALKNDEINSGTDKIYTKKPTWKEV